jgi:hypothetical protein
MSRPVTYFTMACLASIAMLLARPAAAVTMHVSPLPIYQEGTGASFTVGHFIDARTSYPNLTVSGSFRVSCLQPGIPPMSESYSATQTVLFQENVLSMGIPQNLPARRSLSGWTSVPTGTIVPCSYDWQARAVESGLTIGGGGGSVVIGSGERSEGGTIPFDMLKVGTYPGPGCLF